MFKNTASQKLTVFAFADAGHGSLDAGEPVTGDAANISMKIEQDDDGTQTASNDAAPTEVEDGQYRFDLTQAETNGDKLTFYPESSTAGVQVVALPSNVIYTRPPNFGDMGIEADGHVHGDVKEVAGQTASATAGVDFDDLAAILLDTAEIGAAGAGLTSIPWNAAWDAEVQSEVNDGLVAFFTSSAQLVDDVWDEVLTGATHNVSASAGRRLRELGAASIRSGTAQAGSSNSITLDTGASATDQIYDNNLIVITNNTGAGQTRVIVEYDGTSKVATVDQVWEINPDATSEFQIIAAQQLDITHHGIAQAGGASTITLSASASAQDDIYNDQIIVLRTSTGTGQARRITDYDGTSKVATVSPSWDINPDSTSVYAILPSARVDVGEIEGLDATDQIRDAIVDDTTRFSGADIAAILLDTAEIGAAGAGLTEAGGTGDHLTALPESPADVVKISGDATAADRLEAMMDGAIVAQVNDVSATTTAFAADGFTEATDDHFNGRLITFITGALSGQQTDITDYDAAGGTQGAQQFTVTALTEAPADGDFFVIH